MILHKLTEDILCLSQGEQVDPPGFRAAQSRVQRLVEFCDQNDCALVDDPNCVQIVMSRADIAQTLERCLKDSSTASGIAVRAPRYAICKDSARIVDLRAPMIAKPLIAAGTKASHSLLVVLNNDFATSVEYPCILQEYVNHNAEWFKVYVLGDHISVHQRPSLPDLPRDATTNKSVVAFDSQRPYPTLRDFGYDDERTTSTSKRRLNKQMKNSFNATCRR